jgi:adenosylmethionine-8-amino-7-oxononanoate aminotransferase
MTDPLPTYPVASAQGVHLTLNDGRQLIDGMSSWWAAVHGYRHAVLDAAMKKQLEESMSHVMFGGLTHRPGVELAGRLLQLVNGDIINATTSTTDETSSNTTDEEGRSTDDGDVLERMMEHSNSYHFTKVFYSDSGSVSVEVAMKMALQYWFTLHQRNNSTTSHDSNASNCTKTKFLSLRNGYHGDTFGAMSICDPVNGMHSMFSGMLAQQLFVPSPSGPKLEDAIDTLQQMEQMLQRHSGKVAAVVMEPIVQGAGGMKFYHPTVLRRVRELCDEHNVLLIFDEIATGFGRTGTLFAGWQNEKSYRPWSSLDESGNDADEYSSTDKQQQSGVVYPDILCLGKALTGGYMTLGATITTDKLAHGISDSGGVFMHGPTFMGNPLACSVALASLNLLMDSPWQDRVQSVEKSLIRHLSPLADFSSKVREVRVLGAIGVCELHKGLDRDGMARVQRMLVKEGVWLRPFGKLLYTMPPFNCEGLREEHVEKIGDSVYKVVSEM